MMSDKSCIPAAPYVADGQLHQFPLSRNCLPFLKPWEAFGFLSFLGLVILVRFLSLIRVPPEPRRKCFNSEEVVTKHQINK